MRNAGLDEAQAGIKIAGRNSNKTDHFFITFNSNHSEEEMATHSNILAWRIPWTEEPGRL